MKRYKFIAIGPGDDITKKCKIVKRSGFYNDGYELVLIEVNECDFRLTWVDVELEGDECDKEGSFYSYNDAIIDIKKRNDIKEEYYDLWFKDSIDAWKREIDTYEMLEEKKNFIETFHKNRKGEIKEWFDGIMDFVESCSYYYFLRETYDKDLSKVLFILYLEEPWQGIDYFLNRSIEFDKIVEKLKAV